MESINELLGNFEKKLAIDLKLDVLEKVETNLEALTTLIDEISAKRKEIVGKIAGKDTEFSLEEYFTTLYDEINNVYGKFANVIDVTKKLETDRALKEFLVSKLDEILKNVADEASQMFNLSTYEIFNEILNDLKGKMEQKLIQRIETELFSIKTGLGEFRKIYDVLKPQFTSIQDSITNMKEKYQTQYQTQLKSLRAESEIVEALFPKITSLTTTLIHDYDTLQHELGTKLTTIRQTPLQLINDLRTEFNSLKTSHLSQETKLKEEQKKLKTELETTTQKLTSATSSSQLSLAEIEKLRQENLYMKAELDHVSTELEKVSKDFADLAKAKDRKVEMREVLALVMTLLVEVFGAQPHSKILYLLHGQKADMHRDDLTKASGISGAVVRKTLADLDGAKLVSYNVENGKVKLLRRIY